MSLPPPARRRGRVLPTVPRGDVLGTYDSYSEAQSVVNRLARAEFDVSAVAIVGHDLVTVEQVTGRQTWGRAAFAGATTGVWLGLLLGAALFLFTPPSEQTLAYGAAALLIGTGVGMVFGLGMHALRRRSREYVSVHQVLASSYQIIIDPQLTAQAQAALSTTVAD